jgi:long-chain fatty acid transport protein
MPGLRFGLSGQTKMYMTKFEKYAGLFAEQGGFDIPAAITAGFAVDARRI